MPRIYSYIVFFVVMALLVVYTLYRLRTTDYISLPTKAAIVAVTQLEIMRKRHNLIGYALAVPLLSYIFYFLYQVGHRGMIVGACSLIPINENGATIQAIIAMMYRRERLLR